MNRLTIVVEGHMDVTLLRKYLPEIPELTTRFFAGDGRVSLPTVARNLLVHEGGPVLIVMDADSLDLDQAEQNRAMAIATLRRVAAEERFDVFAYLPEHEVIFFEAPEVLERRCGKSLLTPAVLDRGRYDPRQVLEDILAKLKKTRSSWLASLTSEDGESLRAGTQAGRLVTMFRSLASDRTMAA